MNLFRKSFSYLTAAAFKALLQFIPAELGTVLWINDADAAATLSDFPENKVRKVLSVVLQEPELTKLREKQSQPQYLAHAISSFEPEVKRRIVEPDCTTIGEFVV